MTDMNDMSSTGFTDEEILELKRVIVREVQQRPPTIGVVGVSGTGKSSTINSMFRTRLPISHVVACTKEFRDTDLRVTIADGEAAGEGAMLRVIDAPGLGEDVARDAEYLQMYREHLGRCDIILWVISARNRAIALDQAYLSQLEEFQSKIVFGINQVDLVEPCDWCEKIHLPSEAQEQNIKIILEDRKAKIESTLGRSIIIVHYSAKRQYNLPELFAAMIDSCPIERAWIFSAIKGFQPDDFLPEDVRKDVMASVDNGTSKKNRSSSSPEAGSSHCPGNRTAAEGVEGETYAQTSSNPEVSCRCQPATPGKQAVGGIMKRLKRFFVTQG